jgi:RimJ/RimL family protein N-acetyltransferase
LPRLTLTPFGLGVGRFPSAGLALLVVVTSDDWPAVLPLAGRRLLLEPLRVDHADEMAPLLDDPRLHTFIGGEPMALAQLRGLYVRRAGGLSEDGSQGWLNWIARRRDDTQVVGFVQATVTRAEGELSAEVAWLIATRQQHRGYGQEAAQVMADWLRRQGVRTLVAHIHPSHLASNGVARRIGLAPTSDLEEGEVVWLG